MGVAYTLVNTTKQEIISYLHLPASTARELAGNSIAAAVTSWYLLHNRGDQIAFVSDDPNDWPFATGTQAEISGYVDMTDQVIEALIQAEILSDEGIAWADEDEPDNVYIRKLKNIWLA